MPYTPSSAAYDFDLADDGDAPSPAAAKPAPKVQRMRDSPFHKGSGQGAAAQRAPAGASNLGKKPAAAAAAKPPAKKKAAASDSESDVSPPWATSLTYIV